MPPTSASYRDLSLNIEPGMLRFPGDAEPIFSTTILPWDDRVTLTSSDVNLSLHVGTHIDAPAHFIKGAATIDQLPLESFLGEVVVLDLEDGPAEIGAEDLKRALIPEGAKVFIRTRNSSLLHGEAYREDHVFMKADAASYLVDRKCKLVGFDYYNIDCSKHKALPSHHLLAKASIPTIVAIDMSPLKAGAYAFSALPLKLAGLEAAPARVVVW